jgi:hypothetical protein
MTMQLAFYKGRTRLFDRAVQWYTQGPYSHCELVIDGQCYSSSLRDGGVRVKTIDLMSGNWDVVPVAENQKLALDWFTLHLGDKYDTAGLFGFVLPWRLEARSRWFCSEACAEALGFAKSWQLSPNELFRMRRAYA